MRAISEFVGGEKNYSDWSGGIVSGIVTTIRVSVIENVGKGENGCMVTWYCIRHCN